MTFVDWHRGTAIQSPVYLDANVLVGMIVRNHPLYQTCAQLIADLLINRSIIFVSVISLEESIWAMLRLSYCELALQRPNAHFSKKAYKKWCDRIFSAHGSWLTAVSSMVQDWSNAGADIEIVPDTETSWCNAASQTPIYMQQFRLFPADALHLALAKAHARTFITTDSDFQVVNGSSNLGGLTILHLVA